MAAKIGDFQPAFAKGIIPIKFDWRELTEIGGRS
jgi:hypothetical protein